MSMPRRAKIILLATCLLLAGVMAVAWIGGLGTWAGDHIAPLPLGGGRNISFCLDGPTISLCVTRSVPIDDLTVEQRRNLAMAGQLERHRWCAFDLTMGRQSEWCFGDVVTIGDGVSIGVPNVLAIALLLTPAAGVWRHRVRRERRMRRGQCGVCGYDLCGTRGRCPECGSERDMLIAAQAAPTP